MPHSILIRNTRNDRLQYVPDVREGLEIEYVESVQRQVHLRGGDSEEGTKNPGDQGLVQ